MKKSILNIGRALNKETQKSINGGLVSGCGNYIGNTGQFCISHSDCDEGVCHNRCCNTAV